MLDTTCAYYGSPRKEKMIWSCFGGEAFLGGAVAGGTEGVEEAGGEVDFAGEEAARGFLATAIKIGHGKVLLELVHNNENLNETIGPTSGAGPELESRKDSYYASSRQQDHKKRPRQARVAPAVVDNNT